MYVYKNNCMYDLRFANFSQKQETLYKKELILINCAYVRFKFDL